MQPSQQQSGYVYPVSPSTNLTLYDSGYSSYGYSTPSQCSFHYSTCPYAADSFYASSQSYSSFYSPVTHPIQQQSEPVASSTPLQSSNVCLAATVKEPQLRRRAPPPRSIVSTPMICSNRKRISDEAIDRLNAFYAIKKRPTETEKDRLAMECNITIAQVNTWFNNARSRRGDTNPKLAQKLLRQQIDSLNNQVALLKQQHESPSCELDSFLL